MRNFLFVPGNSPKMLSSAGFLGSDAIVIDLEDAIPLTEKDAARILARNAILALKYEVRLGVRINSLDTAWWQDDLRELLPLGPDFIMLPKTADAASIHTLAEAMAALESEQKLPAKTTIIALLETAMGIENAFAIAKASPRVEALFLGAEDLTADLCAVRTKSGEEILYSRGRIVSAARAAGVDAYDTPFTDVEDTEGLRADARLARQCGFTGKAAINPRHIEEINRAFSPSEAEVAYSGEVLAAIEAAAREGKGAVSLHGKMIDPPIVARARYVLRLAGKEVFA